MRRIVVVEDDPDLRHIIVLMLRRAGYDVAEAADGSAGLAAVREHRPDAVVSDIDMPTMSGVEMSQALRADPGTRALPILLISGSLLPGDQGPTQAQATALLKKPFMSRDLLACLDKIWDSGHTEWHVQNVC
jgi:CheY-like chemotaxis protein